MLTSHPGITAGNHCSCGESVAKDGALARPGSECNARCHGNTSQVCGGPDRMGVYTYTCSAQ